MCDRQQSHRETKLKNTPTPQLLDAVRVLDAFRGNGIRIFVNMWPPAEPSQNKTQKRPTPQLLDAPRGNAIRIFVNM